MANIGPSGRPVSSGDGKAPQGPSPGAHIQGPAPGGVHIKDSSMAGFAADVLEASSEAPVIVDFWSPSCAPCKQLSPLLEKVVSETKGAVRLVKINIDENQGLARQLRIQYIPTVYAFKNGQPVDGRAILGRGSCR